MPLFPSLLFFLIIPAFCPLRKPSARFFRGEWAKAPVPERPAPLCKGRQAAPPSIESLTSTGGNTKIVASHKGAIRNEQKLRERPWFPLAAALCIAVTLFVVLTFVALLIVFQLLLGTPVPQLVGSVSNLIPTFAPVIGAVVGGNMFGIVGMLLAIPLAAILDFVYREEFLPALERRRALAEESDR